MKYCAYYMPQRKFPDKAIDVLDLACVGAKRQSERSVSEDMVRDVIEKLTDIPLASRNRLQELKKHLETTMVAQKEVIRKLMGQLEWIEQGTAPWCMALSGESGRWKKDADSSV